MKKEVISQLVKAFEELVHVKDGIEYCFARDIQRVLEYGKWDNFLMVIEKAKTACKNSKYLVDNHFADVSKKVQVGDGALRVIPDSERFCRRDYAF